MSKTYTTIQGDMWDGIAKKVYGTENAVNVLLEANQQYHAVVVFSADIKLVIPDYKAQANTSILPPWRR